MLISVVLLSPFKKDVIWRTPSPCGLDPMACKLAPTGYGLAPMACKLAPTGYGLAPMACKLAPIGYRLSPLAFTVHAVGASPHAAGATPHAEGVPLLSPYIFRVVYIFFVLFSSYLITDIIFRGESKIVLMYCKIYIIK